MRLRLQLSVPLKVRKNVCRGVQTGSCILWVRRIVQRTCSLPGLDQSVIRSPPCPLGWQCGAGCKLARLPEPWLGEEDGGHAPAGA